MKRLFILTIVLTCLNVAHAQRTPEEKLPMTFYALRNMYVDSVDISPIVEEQMRHIMLSLDPHSEYLRASDAAMQEQMLLSATACGKSLCIGKIPDGPLNEQSTKRPEDEMTKRPNDYFTMKSITEARMVNKNTAYICLAIFNQGTVQEFQHAVDSLKKKGMKSMILDIRNNYGGFFETALELADEFLPAGSLLVTTVGAHQPRNEVKAQKKGVFEKGDMVLLVNGQTMSAAEIFAGAIQDWHRGRLIGSRTFGKGLVQETLPFSDGSALRISVARYLTPSGRNIQKPYVDRSREAYFAEAGGIMPDVEIPADTSLEDIINMTTKK